MLLPKRIWKEIPNYEGKYEVSNTGQVRSLNYNHTGKTKILKQPIDNTGYKKVCLKGIPYLVHRLVAQAFIPNPNNLPEVNHKDENKQNNCSWNLEWCLREYNINYGTRNKRASESMKGIKRTEETKKKISKANKGHKHTKETRNKMSEAKKGKYKGKDCPNSKPILMFTKEDQFIRRFDSMADANEYLGKPRDNSNINMCLRGTNKTAYGYIWKYEEDCK